MAVGAGNALLLHVKAWDDVGAWESRARFPGAVRAAAVVSVVVWLGVIALGRAMGYERREPPGLDFGVEWFAANDDVPYGRQTADAGRESGHSTSRQSRR